MSITTRTKTIISGAAAGLALLGLTAIPARAHNYNQATTSTVALHHNQSVTPPTSGKILAQAQTTPTQSQLNQKKMETMQQMNQMMEQCNSMMSMMQNMPGMTGRDNMPGMMNNQNNRPGQDMMNPTPRQ